MGIVYIIIANFMWALELILIRKFFPTQNSFVITAVTSIIAAVFYAPTFLFTSEKFTARDWIMLGVLAFTSLFLAQMLFVKGIQKSPSAILATLAALTMPISSIIMGIVFLKETLTIKAVIGSILMLAGFVVISL
jgi:drug/metabolite transporter (DMT)-like permease